MDESTTATAVEMDRIRPRRPWLAAFLSLLGGRIGQVYTGRFRRSIMLWCAAALVLPAVLAMISLPIGRRGTVLLLLLILGVPIYLAVDAFLLARRNRNSPLKRYQKWWVYFRNERMFINGAEWRDEHAFFDGPLPPFVDMANHGPVIVHYDCCFVLGDNRRNARDSRFLGQIPLADIHGKARLVYWSRDYTFPDPRDGSSAVRGRFRWDRIGQRLD